MSLYGRRPECVVYQSQWEDLKDTKQTFDLNELVLFDDVSHLFLLLFLLIDLLLQSLDLLGELIKPVPVKRSVSDRADECCIGILEGLGENQFL